MFIENGCKFYDLDVDDMSEIDFEEGNPLFEKDGFCYSKETGELFTGIVISNYCGGNSCTEDCYKNGLKHGKSIWWDEDGFILEEGNYKKGKKDGVFRFYNPSSDIISCEVLYKNGVEIKNSK